MSHGRVVVACAVLAVVAWLGMRAGSRVRGSELRAADERPVRHESAALAADDPVARRLPASSPLAPVPVERATQIFVVVSSEEDRVANARVYSLREEGSSERLLGTTDGTGELRTSIAAAEPAAEYVAVHPTGIGRSRARAGTVRIRLSPGVEVNGRVIDLSGAAAPGVTVVAAPCSLLDLAERVPLAEYLAHPEIHVTRTDEDGAFYLGPLSLERQYRIVAGGSGFVLAEPPPTVRPGGEPLELSVAHLYGVRVALVDPAGKAIDPPRVVGAGFGVRMLPIDPAFQFVAGNGLSASFSLEDPSAARRPGLTAHVQAAYLDPSGTRIDVKGAVPGYVPFQALVEVPPIRAGCPEALVVLTPQGQVGTVRLRLDPRPAALSTGRVRNTGVLHMQGPAGELQLGVAFDETGVAETAAAPFGDYRATLHLDPDGVFQSREMLLSVSQPTNECVVDIGATGSVEFEPTAEYSGGESGAYRRLLRLFMGRGAPTVLPDGRQQALEGDFVSFPSGPYVLPVVQPGSYTAFVEEPPTPGAMANFTVRPGETTRISLALRD